MISNQKALETIENIEAWIADRDASPPVPSDVANLMTWCRRLAEQHAQDFDTLKIATACITPAHKLAQGRGSKVPTDDHVAETAVNLALALRRAMTKK